MTQRSGNEGRTGIDRRNESEARYGNLPPDSTAKGKSGGREAEFQELHPDGSHKQEQDKHLNHERRPEERAYSGGSDSHDTRKPAKED